MRILALETNIGKSKAQFINDTEQEVITIPKHVCQFFAAIVPTVLLLGLFLVLMVSLAYAGVTPDILLPITAIGAGIAVLFMIIAYAGWRFDFILLTTDKMVIVDASFLRQTVVPLNLEHVSGVTGQTRWADIFRFGTLLLQFDEPGRGVLELHFIPHVTVVAARITDVITDFQRRKMRVGAPVLAESANMEQAAKIYAEQQDQRVRQTMEQTPGAPQPQPQQPPAPQPQAPPAPPAPQPPPTQPITETPNAPQQKPKRRPAPYIPLAYR